MNLSLEFFPMNDLFHRNHFLGERLRIRVSKPQNGHDSVRIGDAQEFPDPILPSFRFRLILGMVDRSPGGAESQGNGRLIGICGFSLHSSVPGDTLFGA
jgi:hypothetical protein